MPFKLERGPFIDDPEIAEIIERLEVLTTALQNRSLRKYFNFRTALSEIIDLVSDFEEAERLDDYATFINQYTDKLRNLTEKSSFASYLRKMIRDYLKMAQE